MELEFGVGSVVEGKVTGITKFGAFVSLPEGRSGLVHISEIAYSYVSEVSEFLKEGQEVKVKVIGIDDAGRINLSIKKAQDPPPRPEGGFAPRQGSGFAPRQGTGYPPRQGSGFAPRQGGGYPPRQGGFAPRPGAASKEPANFEDRLKQFMAASDSKLAEMRTTEHRTSRKGGRK